MAYRMLIRTLLPTNSPICAKLLDYRFTRCESIHAIKLCSRASHDACFIHDDNKWHVVTHCHLKVIGIVSCSYFHSTRSKFWIDNLIGNNRNQSIDIRQTHRLTNHLSISRIVWINRYCAITEHCFWSRRCNRNLIFTRITIGNLNKFTIYLLMFNFNIRERSKTSRTPIDNPFCSIN